MMAKMPRGAGGATMEQGMALNLSRRSALRGAGRLAAGMVAVATGVPVGFVSAAVPPRWWERIESARAAVGTATPIERGIGLDLPLLSEDGSNVPLTVTVDSPMSEVNFVRDIHLFAIRNPTPEIAVLRLRPVLGRATIATLLRLGETQTVGAIARMSSGEIRVAGREVQVTTSGCFIRADAVTTDEMTPRIRVPTRFSANTPAEIVTQIAHPMETGLRPDATGNLLPQRIVTTFAAMLDGQPVLEVELFRSVAANPYFRFFLAPRQAGRLAFAWTEDSGRRATANADVALG